MGAINELVERDSFMVHWLSQTKMDEIHIAKDTVPAYDTLQHFFKALNCTLVVLNSTTDIGIPSVVVYVTSHTEHKRAWVTAGAGLNITAAISSATTGMLAFFTSNHSVDRNSFFTLPHEYIPFTSKGVGRKERLELWKLPQYAKQLENILNSKKIVTFAQLQKDCPYEHLTKKEELYQLLSLFKNKGNNYDTVYRFISTDYRLRRLGYHTVRIVIPKLYPLYLNEHQAYTQSVRINEFVQWKTGATSWKIQTLPHPFP